MKHLILALCILMVGVSVQARPTIKETSSNGQKGSAYQALFFEVQGEAVVTSGSLVWYAHDIAGFSSIGIEDLETSSGNATTISAMPIYRNGTEMTGEDVTITEGTDLTMIKSNSYKFTYYNNDPSGPTTVTFNFLIAD